MAAEFLPFEGSVPGVELLLASGASLLYRSATMIRIRPFSLVLSSRDGGRGRHRMESL